MSDLIKSWVCIFAYRNKCIILQPIVILFLRTIAYSHAIVIPIMLITFITFITFLISMRILQRKTKIHAVVIFLDQINYIYYQNIEWNWNEKRWKKHQVFPTFIYTSCIVSGSTTLMHINLFECHSISRLILF